MSLVKLIRDALWYQIFFYTLDMPFWYKRVSL